MPSPSMSTPPARPVLGASVAVFREGKVLLIQRARMPDLGSYSLPGGRIEVGETLREGALRELDEETGLCAEIIGFIENAEFIQHDGAGNVRSHAVVAAFAGFWISGEARLSDEISDLVWVDPHAPGDLPMTHGLPAILAKAAALVLGHDQAAYGQPESAA